MVVLDPKNVDVADLLAVIRDIGDRLDTIEEGFGELAEEISEVGAALRRKGKRKARHHHHGPGCQPGPW